MENVGTIADPSVDVIDVAVTGTIADTAPMATIAAIAKAKAKPKPKVKKEVIAAERKVQNQKWRARRVAQRARKAEAVTAVLEEEMWERLTILSVTRYKRSRTYSIGPKMPGTLQMA
jgi:hypothetical protein